MPSSPSAGHSVEYFPDMSPCPTLVIRVRVRSRVRVRVRSRVRVRVRVRSRVRVRDSQSEPPHCGHLGLQSATLGLRVWLTYEGTVHFEVRARSKGHG